MSVLQDNLTLEPNKTLTLILNETSNLNVINTATSFFRNSLDITIVDAEVTSK